MMKKLLMIGLFVAIAIYGLAQPTINSVSDAPDPVEVPGYNNITADITNATQAYVEIYYPNATLMGNYSMLHIAPSTWYYNHTYAYPDPLGTYSYIIKAYNATGWATSATYTFVLQDTTSPSSQINALASYWYNAATTISATASDNYEVANVSLWFRYSNDNATWSTWTFFAKDISSPWSFNFNFPSGEGYYEFYSIANDTAGNSEAAPASADEIAGYDITAPSSSVDAMSYWQTSLPLVITATASDSLSGVKEVTLYYRYSSDNTTWSAWQTFATDGSPPWRWNFNAPSGDGYYEFYTRSQDNASNIEASPLTPDESVGIDTSPPATTLHATPSYGSYITSSSTITLSATDSVSGVAATYYRIWNGSWHPAPGTGVGKNNNFTLYLGAFSLVKGGTNYIEYYSVDNVSNEETTHNTSLYVDDVGPSISNVAVEPSTQNAGGYVNISCSVQDLGVGVESVYLEVTYPDSSTANFTMHYKSCSTYYREETYTIAGVYDFTIYAKDRLGNAAKSAVYHFTITAPNSPPVTTCNLTPSSPNGKNGWYITDVNVTLNATDPDGDTVSFTKYRIDGGAWKTYNGTFTISDEGEHLLEFYSGDDKGNNESMKNVTIKIDKSEPYLVLQRPMPGYLYLFDRQIWPLASGNTIIIGRILVRAVAYDGESDIDNVSFYVNGVLQNIDTVFPYEWLWRGTVGYCYLHVVAYNKAGLKEETMPMLVYIFSL